MTRSFHVMPVCLLFMLNVFSVYAVGDEKKEADVSRNISKHLGSQKSAETRVFGPELSNETWNNIGSALAIYNVANNLRGIKNSWADWRSSSQYKLTKNLNTDFDTLVALHAKLVSMLEVHPKEWKTESGEVQTEVSVTKTLGKGTWDGELYNIAQKLTGVGMEKDDLCKKTLAEGILYIREKLKEADDAVTELLDKLETEEVEVNVPFLMTANAYVTTATRTRDQCVDFDALDAQRIENGDEPLKFSGKELVEYAEDFCRERGVEDCKGFTLFSGEGYETDEEVGGPRSPDKLAIVKSASANSEIQDYLDLQCEQVNVVIREDDKTCPDGGLKLRCGSVLVQTRWRTGFELAELSECFDEADVEVIGYRRMKKWNHLCIEVVENGSSLAASSDGTGTVFTRQPKTENDKIRLLSTAELAAWFREVSAEVDGKGEHLAKQVEANTVNGLAIQAMGKEKMKDILKLGTNALQEKVKCVIDKAMCGDPCEADSCAPGLSRPGIDDFYKTVDPLVFWGAKSSMNGGILSWGWVPLAQRIPRILSHFAGYTNNTYVKTAVGATKRAVDAILNFKYEYGAVNTIASQDWEAEAMSNPLPLLAAFGTLARNLNDRYLWSQCTSYVKWMENTGVVPMEVLEERLIDKHEVFYDAEDGSED